MKNIGEQQIQGYFSRFLESEVRRKFGEQFSFASCDFNGKQDRVFADFFASIDSYNILVEFKEFEVASETRKELRRKLCNTINGSNLDASLLGHFISWRRKSVEKLIIDFESYVSKICPLFGVDVCITPSPSFDYQTFTEEFLEKRIGLSLLDFKEYTNFLAELKDPSGGDPDFFGFLISFDESGMMIMTPFESIGQLIEISKTINIDPPNQSQSKTPIEPEPEDRGPTISMW